MTHEPTGPIEWLEAYLDDALEAPRRAEIERQLERDATLREMLASLRVQRALRQGAWENDPDDAAAVERLVGAVRTAGRHERAWGERSRMLRIIGAMAACLVIGFAAGRMAVFENPSTSDTPAMSERTGGMTASTEQAERARPLVSVAATDAEAHRVTLRDEHGQVIAVYRFDTAEQARRFADDVNDWRPTQRQTAPARPIPLSGGF